MLLKLGSAYPTLDAVQGAPIQAVQIAAVRGSRCRGT